MRTRVGVCPHRLVSLCWAPCDSRLCSTRRVENRLADSNASIQQPPDCVLQDTCLLNRREYPGHMEFIQPTLMRVSYSSSPLLTAHWPQDLSEGVYTWSWQTLVHIARQPPPGEANESVGLRLFGCVTSLLLFGSCVTLGKLLNLSEPHSSSVKWVLE